MKFLKNFKLYLESIDNIKLYKNWKVKYNSTPIHDLNKKLLDRSLITDTNKFDIIIKIIIDKCIEKKLSGNIIFYDFKNQFKILAYINQDENEILIITFLSKDQGVNDIQNFEMI
jgi:hypothetical protein